MNGLRSMSRLKNKILLCLIQKPFWTSSFRAKLCRFTGMKVGEKCFIGECCIFDSIRPDFIELEERATITMRCTILTHYMQPFGDSGRNYEYGKIVVGKGAFVGAHTVICNPVRIGENAVIAAGSVVTKNIPAGEIRGGNPAKFIRKRNSIMTFEESHKRFLEKFETSEYKEET